MPVQSGDRFGRYEIREPIGAGAMGHVFRAFDLRLQREVALKLIAAEVDPRPEARARFEQEARSASALNHPNIITIHDVGEERGSPYIVMELLDGNTLRQMITGPLPLDQLLRLAIQIADALTAAHEQEILHRDLKPENIFVTRRGAVKILDFGLARIFQGSKDAGSLVGTVQRITPQGRSVVGTPGYVAPEVLSGKSVDSRADLFSLGAILYEMACGQPAFSGATMVEHLAATLRDQPPSLRAQRPDLPSLIASIISRCLEKDPQNRYASAKELREELRAALAAGADSPPTRRRRKPIPAPRTPIIGRENELAKMISLLTEEGVRLLTVTGAGGCGKTRLAIAAAEALLPHVRGEVFFVSLGAVSDPAQVVPAILESMGVSIGASDSPLSAVIAELNMTGAPALLVLDNFEQVMGAADKLSELLAACPAVFVIVTSREVLHLYGEHDLPVLPLPLPDPEVHWPPDVLAKTPAVALFLARARAADPSFRFSDETSDAVVKICRRLDGLPLAIELAAARVRTLPPRTLLGRLDQRLPLLTSGARDLPGRQHTLRRTIDWSYDLLTPAEQSLFARLSVFVSGFSLEAAEAVGDPFGAMGANLIDSVASLVDKSLIQKQEDEIGEPRFIMLEIIREYATSLLDQSEDGEATRRAHAAYLLVLAEEGAQALASGESADWLARFAREHDNFRAALDWLVRVENAEWGLRMALALFHFWEETEQLTEGRRRFEALLQLPAANQDEGRRARALFAMGVLASAQGDYQEAVLRTEMSLALHQRRGDQWGEAVAQNALGVDLVQLRELERAADHLEQGLRNWKQLGDERGYARSLSNLASVRRTQGRYEEARQLYDEAAAIFDRTGDRLSAAWALNHQGDVARDQKLAEEATRFYRAALEAFRLLGDPWGSASSLVDLGTMARHRGELGHARSCYREALELFFRLGHRRGIARVLESMAVLSAQQGLVERALTLCSAATRLRQRIGVHAPMVDQEELTHCLEPSRVSIDARREEQARRHGYEMNLAEAIRYAESES